MSFAIILAIEFLLLFVAVQFVTAGNNFLAFVFFVLAFPPFVIAFVQGIKSRLQGSRSPARESFEVHP